MQIVPRESQASTLSFFGLLNLRPGTAILTKTLAKRRTNDIMQSFQNEHLKSKMRREKTEAEATLIPLLFYSKIRTLRIPSAGRHLDFSAPLLNHIERF
jgi:hypothetical protein